MKKSRITIPIALTCILLIVLFSLGTVISYLTDAEAKDNIITIGKVKLEVSEPSYEDSQVVAAGDSLTKNPVIKNMGTEDEYVFCCVAVPKKKVTLLYETDTTITTEEENHTTKKYKEGTPTVNNYNEEGSIVQRNDELYRIIADGRMDGATPTVTPANMVEELNHANDRIYPCTEPQLDFSYNKGNTSQAGWIYLERKIGGENDDFNYYYFGYNTRLLYNKDQENPTETIPVFDRIQLKSFIDEEVGSKTVTDTIISIKPYGIQADSLGIDDVDSLGRNAFLTKEQLEKVWGIVKGKQVTT